MRESWWLRLTIFSISPGEREYYVSETFCNQKLGNEHV